MWLILAIGAPILAWLLGRAGDAIETRRGPNTVSSALKKGSGYLGRRAKGPLGGRAATAPATPRDTGALTH